MRNNYTLITNHLPLGQTGQADELADVCGLRKMVVASER